MVDVKFVIYIVFVGLLKELIIEIGRKKVGNVCMYCMFFIFFDFFLGIVFF